MWQTPLFQSCFCKKNNYFSSIFVWKITNTIYITKNKNIILKLVYTNINNYIKSETFNKTFEQNGLTIMVENDDIYKDHYNYTIDIFNNTNNTILLDTRSKTGTIYISNNNNMKISASLYENLLDDLIIKKNEKKQIKIRFNAIYSNNTEIKNINFEDIIMEYEKYLNNENNYKEREVINIDLKSKE